MKLTIKGAVVYKNILLLKKIIVAHQHEKLGAFNAYIHRKSGQLIFEDEMQPTDVLSLKEYKPVCIRYQPTTPGFEVLEDPFNNLLFDCSDLSPLARQLLSQMIATLNDGLRTTPHPDNLQEVLHEISHADIEAPAPTIEEKDPIHAAFHPCTRIEAEALLENHPIGTYLFRIDPYATLLEEQLSYRHRTPITCYTLTYKKNDHAVADLTLVNKNSHWYIYDDDPSLEETAYSSPQTLLLSIEELTTPLGL